MMTKPCAFCQKPIEIQRVFWKRFCNKHCLNAYHAKERRTAVEEYRKKQ